MRRFNESLSSRADGWIWNCPYTVLWTDFSLLLLYLSWLEVRHAHLAGVHVYAVCIHEYIQQSVWVNIMRRYVGVRFFYPLFKKYSAGARCDEGVVKLGLYGSLFGCVCFLNPLCRHFSLLSERCPNGSPLFARQALFPVDRFGILCLIESLTP